MGVIPSFVSKKHLFTGKLYNGKGWDFLHLLLEYLAPSSKNSKKTSFYFIHLLTKW